MPGDHPYGEPDYEGQTYNQLDLAHTASKVWQNCTFTSTSGAVAALTLHFGCNQLVFYKCTFSAAAWNAISINASGNDIHDITFDGCTVLTAARMGFECTNRPGAATTGYYNINLLNFVVQQSGSEGISFDGQYSGNCLLRNVLIKAAGNGPGTPGWRSEWTWRQAFEINGPTNMTMDHLTIYLSHSVTLNLNGPASGSSGWKFTDCSFDMSKCYLTCNPLCHYDWNGYGAPMAAGTIRGAVFDHCTFNTGTNVRARIYEQNTADEGGGNDFSTCTFIGNDHVKVRDRGYPGDGNKYPPGTVFD